MADTKQHGHLINPLFFLLRKKNGLTNQSNLGELLRVQLFPVVDEGANCITGRFDLLVGLKGCAERHVVNWSHSGSDFISGVQARWVGKEGGSVLV